EKKEEAKKDDVVWKMDYLEKTWGLKLRSATIEKSTGEITLLLSFTKDVEKLAELRAAFATQKNPAMLFYGFDKDDIVVFKVQSGGTKGEITGKEGDAFKCHLINVKQHIEQLKKLEPRAAEKK